MKSLRVPTHLLYSGLLAGLLTGINEYTCTQYVIPAITLFVIILSWTKAGGFLAKRLSSGQTLVSYLIMISVYYLYFPAESGPTSASAFRPWPDILLGALLASSVAYGIRGRRPKLWPGHLWLAVTITGLLMVLVAGVTALMPISLQLEGPAPGIGAFARAFAAGAAILFSSWIVLGDGVEACGGKAGGRFCWLDYRLQVAMVAAAMVFAGGLRTYNTVSEYNLGMGESRRGDLVRATAHLESAAALDRGLRVPGMGIRLNAELARLYEKQLSTAPYNTVVRFKLASIRYSMGMPDAASALLEPVDLRATKLGELERYSSIVTGLPDFAAAHLKLGEAFLARGEPDRAEVEYRKILGTRPHHVMALCGLAEALRREGRSTDAEKAMTGMAAGVEQEAWRGRFGRSLLTEEPSYADLELCRGVWEMEFRISGEPAAGVWPHVVLSVDGSPIADYTISHAGKRTYNARFRVERTGSHRIQFGFDNDFAVFKDGKMVEDRNAHLSDASLRWVGH